jgi:hypothetical protein
MTYSTPFLNATFAFIGVLLTLSACDSTDPVEDPALPTYVIEVSGETFRIQIADPSIAREADSLLAHGIPKIVHGPLLAGDGGINEPYSWHLDSDSISFPDLSIELCDGRPSFIENDLGYWLDTVGLYCPWNAQIIERE